MKFFRFLWNKIKTDPEYLISIFLNLMYIAIAIFLALLFNDYFKRFLRESKEDRATRRLKESELLKEFRQIKADRKREEYEKRQREKNERNNRK